MKHLGNDSLNRLLTEYIFVVLFFINFLWNWFRFRRQKSNLRNNNMQNIQKKYSSPFILPRCS
jgi:hypothetical protein